MALTARQPAASAPMQVDMAECSDSTGMNSVSTCPLSTYVEKYWGISVDGVIGNAPITSGLICFIAKATASLPESLSLMPIFLVPPYFSSLTILMAPKGHVLAQMPQPLQKK